MVDEEEEDDEEEEFECGGGGGGGSSGAGQRRSGRRPHLASECEHLADAERFRGQIIREIAEAIRKIQNPGLGEHALRELNDEINHRLREKWHWNKRIYQLGGLDYNDIERKRQIEEGDTQIHALHHYYYHRHHHRFYGFPHHAWWSICSTWNALFRLDEPFLCKSF